MKDKQHELDSVKWGIIPVTVYRGCLVTKIIGGFDIWGVKCYTGQEVDETIDKAGTILSESIYTPEKLTVTVSGASNSCQNSESGTQVREDENNG